MSTFQFYWCDARRGGGVCKYVIDTLKSKKIPTAAVINRRHLGNCASSMHLMYVCILGTIFRKPYATLESFDSLENIYSREISMERKCFFILGDVNDTFNKSNVKIAGITKKIKQIYKGH